MKRSARGTTAGRANGKQKDADHRPLDAMGGDTVDRFAGTMKRAGYSNKDLITRFGRAVARAPRPRTSGDTQTRNEFHDTSHVLTLWESDPDCVDENGQPIALPIRGPAPSVQALVERARPNLPLEEALDLFLRTHTLRKVGRKLIPTDESIIHTPESRTLSTHHVIVLNQLLRNFEFNSQVRRLTPRWTQRVVECPDFPLDELPMLIAEFAKRANRFLKSYDHSMARTARKARPATKRARTAINLFLSVDSGTRKQPKRRGPQRSR